MKKHPAIRQATRPKETIYKIPGRYLNGRGAAMHYWHTVYYLFTARPEVGNRSQRRSVVTRSQELAELSGLTKRQIDNERPKGWSEPAPFTLIEEETDGGFVLINETYDAAFGAAGKVYEIPTGLVENGWLPLIWQTGRSRLCMAIVGQLLRQPAGQRLLDLPHLTQRCQQAGCKSLPAAGKMLAALDCLGQLGLVLSEERNGRLWYRLQTHRFNVIAQSLLPELNKSLFEHPVVKSSLVQDELRTRRAVTCLQIGRFDIEKHFAEIYRDIGYLTWTQEQETFLMRLSKWASKPPAADRWRDFWSNYCRLRRDRDISRSFSIRHLFDLSRFRMGDVRLPFPKVDEDRLVYVRLLVSADLPDYLWDLGLICEMRVETEQNRAVMQVEIHSKTTQRKHDLRRVHNAGSRVVVCRVVAQQTYPETLVFTQIEAASYKKKRKRKHG